MFIQPFGPAAASGPNWPAFGAPITLPASTLPIINTPPTTSSSCHPKKRCATSTTTPAPPTTSRPVVSNPTPPPTASGGSTGSGNGSAVNLSSAGTTVPAKAASKPTAKRKAAAGPLAANGVYNEPMVLANGGWKGLSLKAATNLKVPILFGLAVALFVLIQALIDRRDPKVSRAPERGDEETVGFE